VKETPAPEVIKKEEPAPKASTEPEVIKPAPTNGSIDLGGEETDDSKIENV
jgi:hypothetical protein